MGNTIRNPSRASGTIAWLASMIIHLGLLTLLIVLLRRQPPSGTTDERAREVGIVLVHQTSDGPRFEGEETEVETTDPTQTVQELADSSATPAADSLENMLPSEVEIQETQADLPQPISSATSLGSSGLPGPMNASSLQAEKFAQGGKPTIQAGGPAHVSLLGVEGVGSKFVYLFDRSVSMEGSLLATAKQELIASLESLESVHQFQIIFFNNQMQAWDHTDGQKRIPFATQRNKRLAINYVQGITASGGTLRIKPLTHALALRPEVLFFLTDTDMEMSANDVRRATQIAVRNGTTIHTIEFGSGRVTQRDNFLRQLAQGTGGEFSYVDTSRLGR